MRQATKEGEREGEKEEGCVSVVMVQTERLGPPHPPSRESICAADTMTYIGFVSKLPSGGPDFFRDQHGLGVRSFDEFSESSHVAEQVSISHMAAG